jgi:ABC-type antimicrobial peptide transport system ATPase subunit
MINRDHTNYEHTRRRRERKRGKKASMFKEILVGKFPNMNIETQKAQSIPRKTIKKNYWRYVVIKSSKFKDKERILKAVRQKEFVIHKGSSIRLSADFST